jgi:DeoR/GlpR family transcriptional regulator of sugar metabolism
MTMSDPIDTQTAAGRHPTLRQMRILELLEPRGLVTVTALADALDVSAVTVRADLGALETQRLVRRVRGGAVAVRPARFERPIDLPSQQFTAEKQRIGRAAAALVRNGETIILDSGSTTLALAHALPDTLADLLVVTNCIEVALVLRDHPGITVFLTGGRLKSANERDKYKTLIPPLAALVLEETNADLAFLCCTGIDPERGFTNGNWEEAELKKLMMRAARRSVFVADHGKIGHIGGARIAPLSAAAGLVTDTGATSGDIAALQAAGLTVTIA